MANANKDGRTIHVFGIVADPYIAGVGLDRDHPLAHPRHLVGYGVLLPVDDVFRFGPDVSGIKSSRRCLESGRSELTALYATIGRQVCQELGIELLEAQVDNPSGIVEAINSLIARDVRRSGIGEILRCPSPGIPFSSWRAARIPVFSILPGDPRRGTLFDMGLDFFEAGKHAGELAGQILHGEDPTHSFRSATSCRRFRAG